MLVLPRLVPLVVAALVAGLLVAPTAAQAARRSSSVTLVTSAASLETGNRLTLRGQSPRGRFAAGDVVRFQQRTSRGWTTIGSGRLDASGVSRHKSRPSPGTYLFRVHKPATTRHQASTSATRRVEVRRASYPLFVQAEPRHVAAGETTTLHVWSHAGSRGEGARVRWERRASDDEWERVGTGRLDTDGNAKVVVRPSGTGSIYRAVQERTSTLEQAVSEPLEVRVVPRPDVVLWVERSHAPVGGVLDFEGEALQHREGDETQLQRLVDGAWEVDAVDDVFEGEVQFSVDPPPGRHRYRLRTMETDRLAQAVSPEVVVTVSDRPVPRATTGSRAVVLNGAPTGMAYSAERPATAVIDAPARTEIRLHSTTGAPWTDHRDGLVVRGPDGDTVPLSRRPQGQYVQPAFVTREAGTYTVTTDAAEASGTWDLSATSPATFSATPDGAAVLMSTGSARGRRLDLAFEGQAESFVRFVAVNDTSVTPSRLVDLSSGQEVRRFTDEDGVLVWRLPSTGKYRFEVRTGVGGETTTEVRLLTGREQRLDVNQPTTRASVKARGGFVVYDVDVEAGKRVTYAASAASLTREDERLNLEVVSAEGFATGRQVRGDAGLLVRGGAAERADRHYVVATFGPRSSGAFDLDVSTPRVYDVGSGERTTTSSGGLAGREIWVRFTAEADTYVDTKPTVGIDYATRGTVAVGRVDYTESFGSFPSELPHHVERAGTFVHVRAPGDAVEVESEVVVHRERPTTVGLGADHRTTIADGRYFRVLRYEAPAGTRLTTTTNDSTFDPSRQIYLEPRRVDHVWQHRDRVTSVPSSRGVVDMVVEARGPGSVDVQTSSPARTTVSPNGPAVRLTTGGVAARELLAVFDAREGDLVTVRTTRREGGAPCQGTLLRDRLSGFEDREDVVETAYRPDAEDRDADGCAGAPLHRIPADGRYQYRLTPLSTAPTAADVEVLVTRPVALDPGSSGTTARAQVSRAGGLAVYSVPAAYDDLLEVTATGGALRRPEDGPLSSTGQADLLARPQGGSTGRGSASSVRYRGAPVTARAQSSASYGDSNASFLVIVDPVGETTGSLDLTLRRTRSAG